MAVFSRRNVAKPSRSKNCTLARDHEQFLGYTLRRPGLYIVLQAGLADWPRWQTDGAERVVAIKHEVAHHDQRVSLARHIVRRAGRVPVRRKRIDSQMSGHSRFLGGATL